jgi:DNA polymerase-3 subunit epsilon
MRQVLLDTETTGLEARDGHRVIEIGVVELLGRRMTERNFHRYLNPGRDSDPGALKVHGLSTEFLADKPRFAEVAADLIAFVGDAEVIIHNASFDLGFLDAEFARLGGRSFSEQCTRITDSLRLARELHPGKRNSLDALCERYGVANRHRTLHGALLDAGLLAEVYLAMTRGQDSLVMDMARAATAAGGQADIDTAQLIVLAASAEECAAHEALLDRLEKERKGPSVWREARDTAAQFS